MNAIVIEHVPVDELPPAWRARLACVPETQGSARVTVRIEAEASAQEDATVFAGDPLFGMWRDREDMADVAGYVRAIRAPRLSMDGTSHKG